MIFSRILNNFDCPAMRDWKKNDSGQCGWSELWGSVDFRVVFVWEDREGVL